MIVVDTSVWVDFFRGRNTPQVEFFVHAVESDAELALTDVVLTEVLQGVVSDQEADRVERRLSAFELLRLDSVDDFRSAAALYRQARRAGFTVRRTLDCLIAAVCLRERAPLLHADADFDRLAECTPLRTVM
ncbi:MAG: Ribonuclease VapC11 [Acidimicrobiales bacterium]|nr:MAG: PIN domain nuclease [Actinomycetota bacterium]MBV6508604.1 Ribonuclease VapC11 [Acidimicrobiales bacterium]RIK08061.1 MAG: PIN domain nuclease [Acidobacteriota bacterium]